MKKSNPYPINFPTRENPNPHEKRYKFSLSPDSSVTFYDEEIIVYQELFIKQTKKPGELAKELGLKLGQVIQMRNRIRRFIMIRKLLSEQHEQRRRKDFHVLKIKLSCWLLYIFKLHCLYQQSFASFCFSYIKLPLNSPRLLEFYNRIAFLNKEAIKLKEYEIHELPLSRKAINCLIRENRNRKMETLEDLILFLETKELSEILNLGKKTEQEILYLLIPINNIMNPLRELLNIFPSSSTTNKKVKPKISLNFVIVGDRVSNHYISIDNESSSN